MNLDKQQLIELSNIAIKAARAAGRIISDHAGADDLGVERKDTGASLASQVVTKVDHMSDEIILTSILPTCESHDLGILTEESEDNFSRFEKDYFWSIDPIDGTLPFIESREGYAVSIGLVSRSGIPQIGVVFDPFNGVLYHAVKGVGIFRNEKTWALKNGEDDGAEFLDRGGAVMNACWVLEHGAAYFYKKPKEENGGGCIWDYPASACLFETAGAWVSDFHGERLELNRREAPYMNHKGILFASNQQIAEKVMSGELP